MNNLTCSVIADSSLFVLNPLAFRFAQSSYLLLAFWFGPPLCLSFGYLQLNLVLSSAFLSDLSILFPASLTSPDMSVMILNENFSAEIMTTEHY